MTASAMRLIVTEARPACWRAAISTPPIPLHDPEMLAELRLPADGIDSDPKLKVVVFDSSDPAFPGAHHDVARGREMPDGPDAAPFPEWPNIGTGLARSRVVAVAEAGARGHGRACALVCDIRCANRERAVFGQFEGAPGVVPGSGATDWLSRSARGSRAIDIQAGADDFDADTTERYGRVKRASPDSERNLPECRTLL
ncbi:enoyl-CoA hydratase/isomerase family protein [Paroceanicella profunda]|uniref:Enoyl-CoA hydratase/isomerase family protein n=1 Tax=Paroceanicella profunda TaxID=2579971 RepID=A0A5B8FQX6_9RHOB|nr:enoyl-CoA hydratase-related protein [Paroceanicella profunda]QDL91096.1 enoyl-CoA hydratase/isomerase family protein [Paroceanicella profunda]